MFDHRPYQLCINSLRPGPTFIKPDQRNPWIKNQLGNDLLSTILAPTVTKFCVIWEGQALPHDTKFGNSRCEIVGRRVIFIWSLIHGSSWSGLIKVGPCDALMCELLDHHAVVQIMTCCLHVPVPSQSEPRMTYPHLGHTGINFGWNVMGNETFSLTKIGEECCHIIW